MNQLIKMGSGAALALAVVLCTPSISRAGGPHSFRIINDGDHGIVNAYISEVDQNRWGRDQLGDDEIDPGDEYTWHWDGDCLQDIKIVYEDQHYRVWSNFDTCTYDLDSHY